MSTFHFIIRYNKLCGHVRKLTTRIKKLNPRDPFRIKLTKDMLNKLYNMGVITTQKNLGLCERITATAFCRRRLPVVMVRLKMSETLREAVNLIEQGRKWNTSSSSSTHIRPHIHKYMYSALIRSYIHTENSNPLSH